MAEYRYTPIEGNVRLLGDSCDIDGTLNVDGATTLVGALTATGGLAALKLVSAPSGTLDGVVWTSGAPALTDGQKYITLTAGLTTYRIPVWANA